MTAPKTLKATVAKTPLEVPVIEDEATTQRIVADVNARFEAIEQASERIDSMAFAVRTALALAADLHRLRVEHEADRQRVKEERIEEAKETMVALRDIAERLDAILHTATPGET